jgi:hypothetical protein
MRFGKVRYILTNIKYYKFIVGYLIQWTLFFLVFNVIAIIVTLYRAGAGGFITDLIKKFW